MGDDELEYHLTFPATNGSAAAAAAVDKVDDEEGDEEVKVVSEDFVFVYEEDKRPVVVLLGWAGCQDKYLAKYSAIYEERSCITLRCTAPVEYLFWRRDRLPRISRRLIQVITERCSTEHPVFFHVFSNGGAIFYQHISCAMQQAGSPLKVKGVIFDSSPGERRITSLYRAISAIIGGHPLTNVPISFMITFFLSFIWLFEILAQSFGKGNATNTDPTALAEETYSWPQIFLYSNADTLIRASDVEKFATRRAERGVRTQLVLFTDSPHVKHYATYRDVYVSTVCNFINECLAEPLDQEANESEDADETDSLLNLTKRIVVPQEAIDQVAKLANDKGKTAFGRKVSSSTSKSKPKENSYRINGSIEHYKRINTLTVFVKRDEKEDQKDEEELKINKYIKNKIEKFQSLSRKANDPAKKPSLTKIREKSASSIKRRSNLEQVVKVYSSKHKLKKTPTESVREATSKVSKDKNEGKLTCGKMTSIATKAGSNQTCSKDHQSREKLYAEKYRQKLKKSTMRIPATRKSIYTFMDPDSVVAENGVKPDQHSDETKKRKPTEVKKKRNLNYLKYQDSCISPEDLQISEIDKQLKEIRTQKKKINQLIFKELKNTKSSWQEVKDKTDLLNVKNIVDRDGISRVNELCQILEHTTKQVYSLHHSLTDLGNQKNVRPNKSKQTSKQNQNSIGSKDDSDVRLFETADKTLERHTRKTFDNYPLNVDIGYAGSDGARENFSHSNISTSVRKTFVDNESSYEFGGDSTAENNSSKEAKSTKCVETTKRNCEVSSQSDVNTSTSFIQKYSVIKQMLPEVFKSEYLKKSCCFE